MNLLAAVFMAYLGTGSALLACYAFLCLGEAVLGFEVRAVCLSLRSCTSAV
jgi:hypothetical protein